MGTSPKPKRSWLERIGAIAILPVSAALTSVSFTWCKHEDLQLTACEYGKFNFHPWIMELAFGLFLPLSLCSYSLLEKTLCFNHCIAKLLHLVFHTVALTLSFVGFASMWQTHVHVEHFQTAHSLMGITLISIYGFNMLVSFVVFYWGSKERRACLHQMHMVVGKWLAIGMVVVMMLGLVETERNVLTKLAHPESHRRRHTGLPNRSLLGWLRLESFLCLLLILAIILVTYRGSPTPYGTKKSKTGKAQTTCELSSTAQSTGTSKKKKRKKIKESKNKAPAEPTSEAKFDTPKPVVPEPVVGEGADDIDDFPSTSDEQEKKSRADRAKNASQKAKPPEPQSSEEKPQPKKTFRISSSDEAESDVESPSSRRRAKRQPRKKRVPLSSGSSSGSDDSLSWKKRARESKKKRAPSPSASESSPQRRPSRGDGMEARRMKI